MSSIDSITVSGIVIQPEAGMGFTQTYGSRRTSTDHPMGDGAMARQTLAGTIGKLTTRISGIGWIPLGLQGINLSQSHVLKCGSPLSISSASNVINLPTTRRSDSGYVPAGFAIVNGLAVSTTIAIVDDEATLGVVSGATAYYVTYYPQITAWLDIDDQSLDSGTGRYGFTINAIEV